MRERRIFKVLGTSLASLLSVLVLTRIVADVPPAATLPRIEPREEAVTDTAIPEEPPHEAPRKKPVRRSPTVAAAKPTLLAAVDQPDILPEHRVLADRVIRALPSGCAQQLRNFYVRYDNPKQRGLGGKETIIVSGNVPAPELAALIVHECGHLAHAAMQGTPAGGDSGFRDGDATFYADSPIVAFFLISWESERILRRGSAAEDFASGYGKTDCFEDFAEFYAAYVLHRPSLIERAKTNSAIAQKLHWMETYMPTPLHGVVESGYAWNGKVPWDVTKLPYRWAVLEIAKVL